MVGDHSSPKTTIWSNTMWGIYVMFTSKFDRYRLQYSPVQGWDDLKYKIINLNLNYTYEIYIYVKKQMACIIAILNLD